MSCKEYCECDKCEEILNKEYKGWIDYVEKYAKKNNLHDYDKAHLIIHCPIRFLRLPKKK